MTTMVEIEAMLDQAAIKVVPFFAYGTLRPGEGLAYLLTADTLRSEPGEVKGYRLYHSKMLGYPRMATGNEDDTVHGDVLWVRRGAMLRWTLEMEARSGYDITIVNAATGSEAETLPVIACVANVGSPGLWELVPSGDWSHRPFVTTFTTGQEG